MAEYTPKNWQCGETITAEDLNHLENGVKEASEGGGGGVIFATLTLTSNTTGTCDLSKEEIELALQNKKLVVLSWAYKPSGYPDYAGLGSSFVEESGGVLGITMSSTKKDWYCTSGYSWNALTS